nr:cyclic lactone autoinducer peptide [uncultured Agathobacter sp.]
MERKNVNSVGKILQMMLKLEANSASCTVMYEPKQPENLAKFKRKTK